MAAGRIQIGQVWRKSETGETFLVTKVYTEALATFAVLRKTGAETEALLRVRVERAGDRKSTRLNSSHIQKSRMPSSA